MSVLKEKIASALGLNTSLRHSRTAPLWALDRSFPGFCSVVFGSVVFGSVVFSSVVFSSVGFFVFSLIALPDAAECQELTKKSGALKLFSGSAVEKANQTPAGSAHPQFRKSAGRTYSRLDDSATQLDTVPDVLATSNYRGAFYLAYVQNVIGVDFFDERESAALAERALLIQAAESVGKVVVGTTLEPLYREAVESVRWFRHYTSVSVVQGSSGAVGVKSGENDSSPLVEFKLHVSANHGVEPRIKFGRDVVLRHDILRDETLLEFSRSF